MRIKTILQVSAVVIVSMGLFFYIFVDLNKSFYQRVADVLYSNNGDKNLGQYERNRDEFKKYIENMRGDLKSSTGSTVWGVLFGMPSNNDILSDHLLEKRKLELAGIMVEAGIDINQKNIFGCTYLHYAVEAKEYEIIKFLLDNNAEIDIKPSSNEDCDFSP